MSAFVCTGSVGLSNSAPSCSRHFAQTCRQQFFGRPVPLRMKASAVPHRRISNQRQSSRPQTRVTTMVVDPWSVSPEFLDVLAAQFFAASLFPYLAFLYYLEKSQNETPKLASFGFRFLLVFVFATIPAGIYAKVHYNDILANIDWLHGSAESLLTLTNLFVTLGMRSAMRSEGDSENVSQTDPAVKLKSSALGVVLMVAAGLASMTPLAFHPEPGNALSLPTWVIHVSSLIEWLVAMSLVWQYSDKSGNPRWKGLTWGMLPLHTSGLCACTYHLFYNSPSLNLLVAVQAALTCAGNATMAFAAYRIATYEGAREPKRIEPSETIAQESDKVFVGKLFLWSTLAAAGVKWGSLYFDPIFDPTPALVASVIAIPTALNIGKWAVRSRAPDSSLGRFL